MTRHGLRSLGFAVLWAIPFLGASPGAKAGDACGQEGCCENAACQPGCDCCPQCGCRLKPVCQVHCEPKKLSVTKYTEACKWICIPPVTRFCDRGEPCSSDGGCGKCCVREVHKLYKYSCPKEECVKKCTVCWTCPNCGCAGGEPGAPQPGVAPPPPAAPLPPGPEIPRVPAPPKPPKSAWRPAEIDR